MVEYTYTLDEILRMPFEAFRHPHSEPVNMEKYMLFKIAQEREGKYKALYPITNELDYASFCRKTVFPQGGLQIGIAGGLQPFLYQSLKGNTDLSIACDISPRQIDLMEDTLQMITAEDKKGFIERFTQKYKDERYNRPELIRNIWNLFSENDFEKIRERTIQGKYKGIEGDFRNTGFPLATEIARTTNIPINIIYLSSIRDFAEYQAQRSKEELLQTVEEYKRLDKLILMAKENNVVSEEAIVIEYNTDWKKGAGRQSPKTMQRKFLMERENGQKIKQQGHIFVKG